MLKKERKYGFRERLLQVHQRNLRDDTLVVGQDEFELAEGIMIAIGKNADIVVETAAKDFVDYLFTSMNLAAAVSRKHGLKGAVNVVVADDTVDMTGADATKGFRIDTDADGITVTGYDARGCAQGLYYLEKCMTIRKAPFIKYGTVKKKPLFSPQMVHSGYGLDNYPNEHLAQIAHEGRDAILIFVKDVDITRCGYMDFNELIYRAAMYGIDVYAYSDILNKVHPEDEGGLAYYENTYGKLFRECPKLKGIVLVESGLAFPSKDPNVRGGADNNDRIDVIPVGKPGTSGYPASDFKQFLSTIQGIIRQYNPKSELIVWNYNLNRQRDAKIRHAWIDQLPEEAVLLMTVAKDVVYRNKTGVKCFSADYTLTYPNVEPQFFVDAEFAHKKGLKIYAMPNTGGLTWDMGVMPYQPGVNLWMERYRDLIKVAKEYGVCGLMESHHFGMYPSIVSKLSNEVFRSGDESMDQQLTDVIIHEFGKEYVKEIKEALSYMSDSNACMTHSRVDSGTVNRVGAVWPLCIKLALKSPTPSYATNGSMMGAKYEDETPWSMDYRLPSESVPEEMESWKKAYEYAEKGVAILKSLENPNENLERLTVLCEYIACQCESGVHAKWWYLKKLQLDRAKKEDVPAIVEEMRELAAVEIKNAERAIACAELDSRLGWEPTMEYIAGPDNLRWKIAQVKYATESELGEYLKAAKEEA